VTLALAAPRPVNRGDEVVEVATAGTVPPNIITVSKASTPKAVKRGRNMLRDTTRSGPETTAPATSIGARVRINARAEVPADNACIARSRFLTVEHDPLRVVQP
jgi:hypothetical protein